MQTDAAVFAAVVTQLRAAGCVFAEDEATLLFEPGVDPAARASLVARRVAGEPLEQVLGWAAFAGLRLFVEPGAFVPRTRTELLAELAIMRAQPGDTVVDLCCGVGAIGAAMLAAERSIELYASDVEPAAVRAARRNLPAERVFEGDLFAPLPPDLRGRVAVIACNAPYVPSDAIALMPPEARDHEARITLDGGGDGLDVQRRVLAEAPAWLASTGALLFECSEAQAPASLRLVDAAGLVATVVRDDERDATVVVGVMP